ncbi:hypothetical protein AMTR_s00020p00150360 [Amborella trichopoda]|uniref:Uncharacterized protein n=1 Tax=Amborella trichopoda TaxID=13333 RepID=W1PWV5_AMBTC|nr:hypothetical protein AMTR_s00020p00150360 [Amborella trichopoda]
MGENGGKRAATNCCLVRGDRGRERWGQWEAWLQAMETRWMEMRGRGSLVREPQSGIRDVERCEDRGCERGGGQGVKF